MKEKQNPSNPDELHDLLIDYGYEESEINDLFNISNYKEALDEINYDEYMTAFGKAENIAVKAYYDQSRQLQYTEDEYLKILTDPEFDNLTTDEAERIKTITYYTFTSIPLQANTSILIDYRIYAN